MTIPPEPRRDPRDKDAEARVSAQTSGADVRVLVVAPTPFFGDYGCHVRILEEIRAIQARGARVVLCTYPQGEPAPPVDIRRVPYLAGPKVFNPGSSFHKVPTDALLLLKTFQVAWQERPTVIHGHLHEGALIGYISSRLRGCPLVFDFQGSLSAEMVDHGFLRPEGPFYKPMRRLETIIDRLADTVVTSTEHGARLLESEFHCPASKIVVLRDGVNLDLFVPLNGEPGDAARRQRVDALRESLGIPEESRVVAYIGLLAEYQGITPLLSAAREVVRIAPDTHFLIMGYPGEARYKALAAQLDISRYVTFTGRISYHQAPDYLAMADLAVSPKMSASEGNGKLLNYMAMALPVVAFDTPVNREILGDLGFYAPVGDHQALALMLLEALSDPPGARRVGALLRERAERYYGWSSLGEEIISLYRRLTR